MPALVPPALVLGEGIPVVLLHAFPLDGRMWMGQAESLADVCQVIVPDLRGFGEAFHQLNGADEITIDSAADDIAALLDDRGLESAVVGGISRGGVISLAFARRHPGRLKALMLLDTRAAPADDKERQTWGQMIEALQWMGVKFVPEAMKNRLFGPTALRDKLDLVERVNSMMLSQEPAAVSAAARGMANRPDARPGLAEIRAPLLALAGVEDGAFGNTKAIAEAVPGARFVAVDAAGHLSNLEEPDEVTAHMREFLTSLV